MTTRKGIRFAFAIVAAVGLYAALAHAQFRGGGPYREAGRACVYGKSGEVLLAPEGADCAVQKPHGSPSATAPSGNRFAGLPAALRADVEALIATHTHVAEDLEDLRRAVVQVDQKGELAISDAMVRELREHLEGEERVFEGLASEHRSH